MHRRSVFALIAGLALAPVALRGARAAEPAVYTGLVSGTGAGGYDVVAYFTEGAATPGSEAITAEHEGVAYRFASEENRAAFLADPARHLPAYGGYCAFAVAKGYTAKGDPEAFTVADGKLYLNYSKSIRARWLENRDALIADANGNWPKVLGK